MSRYIDPVPQYLDDNGDPLVNAKLWFFRSGTNTPLTTYADAQETIPNTNPVELGADARAPNIHFTGSAKVILTADKPEYALTDQQVWERDPVGTETAFSNFEEWDQIVNYDINDFVIGSDGEIYRSRADDNQGNDPTTSPDDWEQVRFIGVWNVNISYQIGNVVQTSDGSLWKGLTTNNTSNDPITDDGTNWIPAIEGSKVPEIIELNARNLWNGENAAFNVLANRRYQIDASAGAVDGTLPLSLNIGDEIIVHNESVSTNTVRLTNTNLTLRGPTGTITTADNLVLDPGDTAYIAMKTTTDGEFV